MRWREHPAFIKTPESDNTPFSHFYGDSTYQGHSYKARVIMKWTGEKHEWQFEAALFGADVAKSCNTLAEALNAAHEVFTKKYAKVNKQPYYIAAKLNATYHE